MSTELMIIAGICIVVIVVIVILFITFSKTKGMEKTLTKMGNELVKAQANIIKNNEDIMKETANRTANINKDATKTMANAVKEGFFGDNKCYCKYCGALIDNDSRFCKNCGKEL